MIRMQDQAQRYGARVLTEDVIEVDLKRRPFVVKDSAGAVVEAHALVIATGASANYLGLESEQRYKNMGVSACAVCDGALPRFRNQPLIVVGGGDSAAEEGNYLTKFASVIHLITAATR
jgi:thioredoxin reductase (NADPH)